MSDSSTDEAEETDPFEEYRQIDVEVTSNAADGATVDINGTELLIKQHSRHVPLIVGVWVEDESMPLGTFNVARGETVTLGGADERLADQVEAIKDLPVEEIPAALDELAYRLNPSGREPPDGCQAADDDATEGGESDG